MTTRTAVSAAPASLWLRALAAIYDLLPLLALMFIATVLALIVTAGALDVRRAADRLLVQSLVLVISAAYYIVSWMRGGQTIGMRPWRLRVVRNDGSALDLKTALLRFLVAMVSLASAGLGFWWALIDERKRTWHDLAAGTLVVQLDRQNADPPPSGF